MSANIRILLIEDDQDDIDLLMDAVKENGIHAEFEILMQGNRIISWLEESKTIPDIIVMDLNLPKMHGREVLKHIKQHYKTRLVPVLVLTTSSQPEEKQYCLQHGAGQFITKPATTDGFASLVETISRMARTSVAG